jgi:hypothetical protein
MGKQLTRNGLYGIYKGYKEKFFPKLLEDNTIPMKIKKGLRVCLLNHLIPTSAAIGH